MGEADATREITPPRDCWVTLRVGGERMTKVEVKADERVRLEVRRRDC